MLLADSSAVLDSKRNLPQHLSAITLIDKKLQDPSKHELRWLDLACGKGQIISLLLNNLPAQNRKKINFLGYDIHPEHTRTAGMKANALGLNSFSFHHGDLCDFTKVLPENMYYDFITCTNTIHELHPYIFADLLIDAILSLSSDGELFLYDMETYDAPELGAFFWRGTEINRLLKILFETLACEYKVYPNVWSHKSCNGWSVIIQKQFLKMSNDEINNKKDLLKTKVREEIDKLLDERFNKCIETLEFYQKCGGEQEKGTLAALYEFWAIYYAKERT